MNKRHYCMKMQVGKIQTAESMAEGIYEWLVWGNLLFGVQRNLAHFKRDNGMLGLSETI